MIKCIRKLCQHVFLKCDLKQLAIGIMLGLLISICYQSSMFLKINDSVFMLENTKNDLDSVDLLNELIKESKEQLIKTTNANNKCNYGKRGPKVLCAILTYPKNFNKRAKIVDMTWGKRCDKTIYFTGRSDKNEMNVKTDLNVVYLNISETNDRWKLTDKTISVILYNYKHLLEEYDWFMKADDDTYVIVENLKYFLANKCPNDQNYYGYIYNPHPPEKYNFEFNSGGAGYLMSRETIRKFSEKYYADEKFCRQNTGAEDADIGKCFQQINVKPGETRDKLGRERFHPLSYDMMWNLSSQHWTYLHSKNRIRWGEDCCSDSTISFHYEPEDRMRKLDKLIYSMRPKSYTFNHNDYFNA